MISFEIHSQIEVVSDSKNSKKDTVKRKNSTILKGTTEIFIETNWGKSFRKLEKNGDLYGKELGTRADEKSITTWSYGLGFRNYLSEHLAWEGGVSLLKNGEKYDYKAIDTTFSYQTTYTYIAMPVKFYYCVGKQFRLFIGGGLIPQFFNHYRQDQQWTQKFNQTGSATIKTNSDLNSFLLSGCLTTILQFNYTKNWSFFVSPEYRTQLNSTYLKTNSYKHYARTYGINFGFVYSL